MPVMVRVKPAKGLRREFARWASGRRLRTVSESEFHVPVELIPSVPERVLAGALIDGVPYVASDARRVPAGGGPVKRERAMEAARAGGKTMLRADPVTGAAEVVVVDAETAPVTPEPPAVTPAEPTVTAEPDNGPSSVDVDSLAADANDEPAGEPGTGDPAVAEQVEAPAAGSPAEEPAPAKDPLHCEVCDRRFKKPGGRTSHDKQVHGKDS